MASADFSFALTKELSPGKVLFLSLHTVRLYLARLDGLWASLRPASLPPVRGLSADSCSYGQRFVPRFLQLGRAACAPRLPPCGSLRLPPSVPVSTLQLTRNSPCWAHWRGRPRLPHRHSCRCSGLDRHVGVEPQVSVRVPTRQVWGPAPHWAEPLSASDLWVDKFRAHRTHSLGVGARFGRAGHTYPLGAPWHRARGDVCLTKPNLQNFQEKRALWLQSVSTSAARPR